MCGLVAELSSQVFWRTPFTALVGPKQMTEFMVMDVERIDDRNRPHRTPVSHKVCTKKYNNDNNNSPLLFWPGLKFEPPNLFFGLERIFFL